MRNKEYRDSFVASQISNTIAAQIFALREARGWKQAEVAARAGMKQSRISDLEDPNYENYQTRTLLKLASAYDVGLVVRFVPFSELAKWSSNLSPKDFLPTEFLKDGIPEFEDIKFAQESASAKTAAFATGSFSLVPDIHSSEAELLYNCVHRGSVSGISGGNAAGMTYAGAVT